MNCGSDTNADGFLFFFFLNQGLRLSDNFIHSDVAIGGGWLHFPNETCESKL